MSIASFNVIMLGFKAKSVDLGSQNLKFLLHFSFQAL